MYVYIYIYICTGNYGGACLRAPTSDDAKRSKRMIYIYIYTYISNFVYTSIIISTI